MAFLEARSGLVAAALIALGMLGAGWLIGDGFQKGRADEHYVTVKGLAETFVRPISRSGRCATPRPATT